MNQDETVRNKLILVDDRDNEIGYGNFEDCHSGTLQRHRAFSVFIFNDAGEMLITQRSARKKTWPLFWSNACCSHPRAGQDCGSAALVRMHEELGVSTDIQFLFKFEYNARFDDEWGEHEMDWVFKGRHNGPLQPNRDEIHDWKFIPLHDLALHIQSAPGEYTPWFRLSLQRVIGA
jgi:isopentenyl-diphosphate delta-isomerase